MSIKSPEMKTEITVESQLECRNWKFEKLRNQKVKRKLAFKQLLINQKKSVAVISVHHFWLLIDEPTFSNSNCDSTVISFFISGDLMHYFSVCLFFGIRTDILT